MRKKVVTIMLAILAGVIALPAPTQAVSILSGGQKQFYSVQMRSDSQSIVYAKIIFEAQGADNLTDYTFTLPSGIAIDNVSVQQILAKSTSQPCVTYEPLETWRQRVGAITPSTSAYQQSRKCIDYGTTTTYNEDYDFDTNTPIDSYEYYYPTYYQKRSNDFEYKDIKPVVNGQKYTLTLPEPIKPTKQGALLLSYTSKSYVTLSALGYYQYDFRTLISSTLIDTATVAINFDEDLYSRDASQRRETNKTTSADTGLSSGARSYQSGSLDDRQSAVGQGGQITKVQSKMLPNDTVSITGAFATNKFVLFGKEIVIGLVAFALIAVGIWRYRIYRALHPRTKIDSKSTESGAKPRGIFMGALSGQGNNRLSVAAMLGVSATSIVGTIAIFIAILGIASVLGLYTSDVAVGLVLIVGLIVASLFSLVIIPLSYILLYESQRVFVWALFHTLMIVIVVILTLIMFSNMAADLPIAL